MISKHISYIALLNKLKLIFFNTVKWFHLISKIQFSISTQFNIKSTQLNMKTVLFQTIQFSISTQFDIKSTQLNMKTVLFQTIQFSISTQFEP